MTSPYPLSAELAGFVAQTLAFNATEPGLNGMREAYSRMSRAFTPERPAGLAVTELELGGVPARRYQPGGVRPENGWPGVLYLHGGGWVVGDLDSHDFITADLAAQLNAVVIAVDYRLAPEHPFPAAFDDCLAAWRGINAAHHDLGIDPRRLAVAGDSAGGNLAAALCLALRDTGEPLPCGQALIYPGLGGGHDLPSRSQCADAPLLSSADLDCYLALYLSDASQQHNPYVMPLQACNFAQLPAAFIAVAEFDPLHDDGLSYRDALTAAGVPVAFHPGLGLVHGCLRARGLAAEVDLLYAQLLAALRRFLGLGAS
ncbi:alpha/beta hydrolase [Pseudomonas cavernicola]|uniref:Alpha/beta hydrolase n=1 Tax=Pseudomonas cavernicola TaxID=2320866 RepID=A0A418XIU0_9PSED|nr:alpha/beta hydrolase [Pseudomonas cavernicola]RJG12398.1 alpha/beta hydrolase [Pseudomonas cavernicola]